MTVDHAAKERQLESLQIKASVLREEIAQYYDLLLQEFWKDFPMLSYCEEVVFPLQQTEPWLGQVTDDE